MLVCLIFSQRSLKLSSVLFILFTLLCSSEVIFTILSSSSLICSSASVILLLIPCYVFFISVIVLFIWFFCCSLNLLLVKHFLYFLSLCLHSFFVAVEILHHFTVISLNSFPGILPISSSFSCSCGVFCLAPSSAPYFFVISFCLTFCLWSPFCRLQDSSSSCF